MSLDFVCPVCGEVSRWCDHCGTVYALYLHLQTPPEEWGRDYELYCVNCISQIREDLRHDQT